MVTCASAPSLVPANETAAALRSDFRVLVSPAIFQCTRGYDSRGGLRNRIRTTKSRLLQGQTGKPFDPCHYFSLVLRLEPATAHRHEQRCEVKSCNRKRAMTCEFASTYPSNGVRRFLMPPICVSAMDEQATKERSDENFRAGEFPADSSDSSRHGLSLAATIQEGDQGSLLNASSDIWSETFRSYLAPIASCDINERGWSRLSGPLNVSAPTSPCGSPRALFRTPTPCEGSCSDTPPTPPAPFLFYRPRRHLVFAGQDSTPSDFSG
eukprot:1966229-Rhodomonas_salina.4